MLGLLALLAGIPTTSGRAQSTPACGYQSLIAELLSNFDAQHWQQRLRQISGAEPVQINGQPALLRSRHTWRMFIGDPDARAFGYAQQELAGLLGQRARFEVDPFLVYKPPDEIYNGQNLIVDLPGATRPDEIVVLSAHLDSLSTQLNAPAPGADDNAAGVAALLEAARLFAGYRFERTVRLVLFTGEEQHEVGSRAYLADHPPRGVVAVVNIDMVGYDADHDRCIELHAGLLPASLPVAQCVQDVIQSYNLDLKTEVITAGATIESDQSSYWAYGVGAVMLWENATPPLPGGVCQGTDLNPYYHTAGDTPERVDLSVAGAASRAAIGTVAALARPLERCTVAACSAQPAESVSARPGVRRFTLRRPYAE